VAHEIQQGDGGMSTVDASGELPRPAPIAFDVQPLDPRYVRLQREVGRILVAVAGVGLLAVLFVVFGRVFWPWRVLVWTAAVAALAWHSHMWPPIEYRHMGYRVDEQGLEFRRGVYWRRVINVPRTRVQHTDVVQGPLERRHGLGRLVVYTAGTEHSRVELPGLEHTTALTLRDHLLPREGGDAV
jgi:membrane protein YdbS with pleckstrin-like domain